MFAGAIFFSLRLLTQTAALPSPDCAIIGRDIGVVTQVEARRGWVVVSLAMLPEDDRVLWTQAHAGRCPGIAAGHFDGAKRQSFALALVQQGGSLGRYREKLLLLRPAGSGYASTVLVGPTEVTSPFVVWSVPPGRYTGVGRRAPVVIPTDSFIYEKMEAFATQYYFQNGRTRSFVVVD